MAHDCRGGLLEYYWTPSAFHELPSTATPWTSGLRSHLNATMFEAERPMSGSEAAPESIPPKCQYNHALAIF